MDSKPTIQVTPQLLVIILIVLAALALPLAVTSWFLVQHFNTRPSVETPPEVAAEVSGLRASLESIADTALPPATVEASNLWTARSENPVGAASQMKTWIESVGGSVLEMPPDTGSETSSRLLVTIPSAQIAPLRERLNFEAESGGGDLSGESVFLDIRIEKSP